MDVPPPATEGRRAASTMALAFVAWLAAVAGTSAFQVAKIPALTDLLGPAGYRHSGQALEGQVQAAYFVAWALASVAFGRFADVRGRVAALRWASCLVVLGSIATALVGSPAAMFAARVLTALGGGGVWGPAVSLVAERVRLRFGASPNGLVQTATSLGHLAAATANLALARASWRWVFVCVAALGAIAVALALLHPREAAAVAEEKREATAWPPLRPLLVGFCLGVVGITASVHVGFWLPNLTSDVLAGAPPDELRRWISWAVMLSQGGAVAGIVAASWLAQLGSRRRAVLIFTVCAAAALALVPSSVAGRGALLAAAPALGFFATGWTGLLAAYLPELFEARCRATGAGVAYNLGRVATAGQLALMGGVVASSGPRAALSWGAAVYPIALAALIWAPETARRRAGAGATGPGLPPAKG